MPWKKTGRASFRRSTAGLTSTEFALACALIAIVAALSVKEIGGAMSGSMLTMADNVSGGDDPAPNKGGGDGAPNEPAGGNDPAGNDPAGNDQGGDPNAGSDPASDPNANDGGKKKKKKKKKKK